MALLVVYLREKTKSRMSNHRVVPTYPIDATGRMAHTGATKYLRHTTRRKDGNAHTYWRVVRSVRVGRKVIQQTVAHLGELDTKGRTRAKALARTLLGTSAQRRTCSSVKGLPSMAVELCVVLTRASRCRLGIHGIWTVAARIHSRNTAMASSSPTTRANTVNCGWYAMVPG